MAAALEKPRFVVREIEGGRLHLQDGPIDVVLQAWGEAAAVSRAKTAAAQRFSTILGELTSELSELRRPMRENPLASTPAARRMLAACAPFAEEFITPMAAVAGSVADELLAAMRDAAPLDRAFVNDGGDIALFVAPGQTLSVGLVAELSRGVTGLLDGAVAIDAQSGIGGVATSGWPGRSFSMGIAEAVTVLARDAAAADAAATLIANATWIDSAAVLRAPASSLDPDSDLGGKLVTVDVGPLHGEEIARALAQGVTRAREFQARGLIVDAAIAVKGRTRAAGMRSI